MSKSASQVLRNNNSNNNTALQIKTNKNVSFLVPSFKNTASIFPETFFIQYLTILVANLMTSSLS